MINLSGLFEILLQISCQSMSNKNLPKQLSSLPIEARMDNDNRKRIMKTTKKLKRNGLVFF